MPLPLAGKKKKAKRNHPSVQHPYSIKLDCKLSKLDTLLNQIYELADGNFLVSNAEIGLMDFSINEKFARKLEDTSKCVAGLANRLCEKATQIIEKCDEAHDRKVNMQDIILVGEVTDYKLKCPETKKRPQKKFIPSQDFRIKVEWISDDSDDDDTDATKPQEFSGELDGHFAYPKQNKNPVEIHSFICDHCEGVFRDKNELQNHYTNHRIEFFQCLVCDEIYRSVRSFETHKKSHDELHVCLVCRKGFQLKTSLTNHEQTHSDDRMTCSKDGCEKSFKNWQNQVEHIRWGHRKNKECPCTICGKLFQTPTNMRSHRLRQHGKARELIPGYPVTKRNEKCTAVPTKVDSSKKTEKRTYFRAEEFNFTFKFTANKVDLSSVCLKEMRKRLMRMVFISYTFCSLSGKFSKRFMTMDFSLLTFFSMSGKLRKRVTSMAVTLMRMDLIFLTFFSVSGKFRKVF